MCPVLALIVDACVPPFLVGLLLPVLVLVLQVVLLLHYAVLSYRMSQFDVVLCMAVDLMEGLCVGDLHFASLYP